MRIPLYAAILLCLFTVSLVWWVATRDINFLTSPSDARRNEIREETLASLPTSRLEADAYVINFPSSEDHFTLSDRVAPIVPVELGNIKSPTRLDTYADRAPEGSAKLLALAAALETKRAFQRALLAYERILDLAESDPEQIQTAVSAIRRIKPTLPAWNTNSKASARAVIHIGTGEKFAKILPEIIAEITRKLNSSTSGIVSFSHELHIGRTIQNAEVPTPFALWITGSGQGAPSTDVLSFTANDPKNLRNDLLKTTFNLIRGHLSKTSSYNPAPEALENPLEALESHITRLLWNEFGKSITPEP